MARKKDDAIDMQVQAHEKTYAGFIRFSTIGTFAVMNFVLCLLLFGLADGFFAKWLAGVGGVVATLAATAVGIGVKSASWRPNAIIFVGLGLVTILYFAG